LSLKTFTDTYDLRTPLLAGTPDIKGWQSNSPALDYVIHNTQPSSIIEVGSWVGASAIHMANQTNNPDLQILCIDSVLGSNAALWLPPYKMKATPHHLPQFELFSINISSEQLNDTIAALPTTSSTAAEMLAAYPVTADLVYIDAGHRERDVYADLQDFWPLTGKALIGDDFSPTWPGVVIAAERFAYEQKLDLQVMDHKFILWR
jgi:cephalosporin hydroxylase